MEGPMGKENDGGPKTKYHAIYEAFNAQYIEGSRYLSLAKYSGEINIKFVTVFHRVTGE